MLGDICLLHSLWRNSLAQGRLVTRTVAFCSLLPGMTSKKIECTDSLGVHHIPQKEETPRFLLCFGSPQLMLAEMNGGGIGRGQRCHLHLARSCLGASGGQPACTAEVTFPSPTCGTVSRQRYIVFATHGAPSTRMHFGCDPSCSCAIWLMLVARFNFLISFPWIVALVN